MPLRLQGEFAKEINACFPNAILHLFDTFFLPGYLGISNTINDFKKEIGEQMVKLPIGDHCGIAIVKL